MAHDVFISHAAEDKTSADMLCATLEQQGVRCWVAPRDVRPGTDWRSAILAAIRDSRAMVLIFSEHANASKHVNREVDCAIEAGIPVVPFRTENVPPRGALEYSLYGVHWLDAVTPPLDAHMKRLASLLVAMCAGDAGAAKTVAGAPRSNTLGLSDPAEIRESGSDRRQSKDRRRSRPWPAIGIGVAIAAVAIALFVFTRKPAQPADVTKPPAPIVPTADTTPPLASAPASAPIIPPVTPPADAPPTPASAGPAAAAVVPADAVMFPAGQGELVWEVDPSRAGDFESAWKKIVEGLLRSTSPDYQNAGRGLMLGKSSAAGKSIYAAYVDPAVAGVNYQPGYLLSNSGSFDRSEIDALYKKVSDGVISLRSVPLERISLLPADSTPVDQSPVMGMREAKDAFAFSSDQAQIIWQLKPGKRAEFEAAWREIVAALLRSPNERIRDAVRSITAFRAAQETLVIFRMDHPVKGLSYDPGQLMFYAGTLPRVTQDALAGAVRGAIDGATPWPMSAIR